jgi:hypothetical protein
MSDIAETEFKRRARILDMMLSAHSLLRDRYERRATGLTLLVMGLSILATGVAFISGSSDVTILGITATVQVWVGVLTCVIFALSIVELLVEWRRRTWAHGEAARNLADLKARFGHAEHDGAVAHSDFDLILAYDETMDALHALDVRIPEAKFNRLKARHLRKVQISRCISARPQRPVLLHRLDVLREGLGRERSAAAAPTGSASPPPASRPGGQG